MYDTYSVYNPQYWWLMSIPSLFFIILIVCFLFVIVRRFQKQYSRKKILDETYGPIPTMVMEKDPEAGDQQAEEEQHHGKGQEAV